MANFFNKKRVSLRNLGFCRNPNRFRRKKISKLGKRPKACISDGEDSDFISYQSLLNLSSRSNIQNCLSIDKNLNSSQSFLSVKNEDSDSLENERTTVQMESFLEYARNGNLDKVKEISNNLKYSGFNINYRGKYKRCYQIS